MQDNLTDLTTDDINMKNVLNLNSYKKLILKEENVASIIPTFSELQLVAAWDHQKADSSYDGEVVGNKNDWDLTFTYNIDSITNDSDVKKTQWTSQELQDILNDKVVNKNRIFISSKNFYRINCENFRNIKIKYNIANEEGLIKIKYRGMDGIFYEITPSNCKDEEQMITTSKIEIIKEASGKPTWINYFNLEIEDAYTIGTANRFEMPTMFELVEDKQRFLVETPKVSFENVMENTLNGFPIDIILKSNAKYELIYNADKKKFEANCIASGIIYDITLNHNVNRIELPKLVDRLVEGNIYTIQIIGYSDNEELTLPIYLNNMHLTELNTAQSRIKNNPPLFFSVYKNNSNKVISYYIPNTSFASIIDIDKTAALTVGYQRIIPAETRIIIKEIG